MANQTFFQRRNDSMWNAQVSLLCIYPRPVSPPAASGQAYTGLVDLECDDAGNFPEYVASEITFDLDSSNFNITYTCQTPITLPSSGQTYQTVMLPIFYDTGSIVPYSSDPTYGSPVGVFVTINYPDGSLDGDGLKLTQKVKKGQPSSSNPHVQPDYIGGGVKKIIKPLVVNFNEGDSGTNNTNPSDLFGVPRFQIIQSYTQQNQYFILVIATNESDAGDAISAPISVNIIPPSQINMVFVQNNANFPTQVVGAIPSSYNQFSNVLTSNSGNPNKPATSVAIPINNNVGDTANDYDTNAILM